MQLYSVIILQTATPIRTYCLPESGTRRQPRWQRWHRWHPDAQRTIGTWSETRTKPLRLWSTVSTRESRKTTLATSNEGETLYSVELQTIFTQRKTAELHTQGTWRFQKAKCHMLRHQYSGFFLILWGACIKKKKKNQPLGYKQKCDPSAEHGNMASSVHVFLSGASAWSGPQGSNSSEGSSQSVSSTFHTHYRALYTAFMP